LNPLQSSTASVTNASLPKTLASDTPPPEAPHSGYHWRKQSERFFEGWYFRLTLPEPAQTFAFMYSIDDPAGNGQHSGGAAQILGPHEDYYCRTFPDVSQFWAWLPRLGLGHWQRSRAQAQYLTPSLFTEQVQEGYQATASLHQGKLLLPSGDIKAQWHYETQVLSSWGSPTPQATAGWLSFFSIFEPGWQVLTAHALATGWIEWRSDNQNEPDSNLTRYDFQNAPAYAEKNWGGAFPAKWFWMQCNAFAAAPSLSVTAAAGIREVLFLKENVGLIGIHYQGQFYEFLSRKTQFSWAVDPWGYWQVSAESFSHRVVLTGRATDAGAWVRVPTKEGLQFCCRDTTHGHLTLQLWKRGTQETLIIEANSDLAGLEIGGEPWQERWVISNQTN